MIDVLTAAKEGKRIQRALPVQNPAWCYDRCPMWDFNIYIYRVEPEPLTLWANIMIDRNWNHVYTSENEARKDAMPLSDFSRVAVKVREVTDD